MDNLYDHGILFRYIVGFKEQMKKIVIFKPYVSLIITGSVKCKFVPSLFIKYKKIGANEECLKFAGRISARPWV